MILWDEKGKSGRNLLKSSKATRNYFFPACLLYISGNHFRKSAGNNEPMLCHWKVSDQFVSPTVMIIFSPDFLISELAHSVVI